MIAIIRIAVVLCLVQFGLLAQKTVTVCPSGCTYSSLNAAEAAEQGTLTEPLIIECQTMSDTTAVTFAGYVTTAANDITIIAPAGHRHAGVWTTGAYRLEVSSGTALQLENSHINVKHLQIYSATGVALEDGTGGIDGIDISHTIFRGANQNVSLVQVDKFLTATTTWRIWNCLFYDVPNFHYGIRLNGSGGERLTLYAYNNTFASLGRAIYTRASTILIARNNVFSATATAIFDDSSTVTSDYNSTNLSTLTQTPGPNDRVNQNFSFVNPAGDNYKLDRPDKGAADLGTDLSSDPDLPVTDDITGTARVLYDIGAFISVPAVWTVKASGGDFSSLNAAEAGLQSVLTRPYTIECYAFEDVTAVTFNGWTTSADAYVQLVVPPSDRHNGAWSESAYRLVVANSVALTIRVDHVRVDGFQISKSSTSGNGQNAISIFSVGSGARVDISNTILKHHSSGSFREAGVSVGDADATVNIWNCIDFGHPDVVSLYNSSVVVDLGIVNVYSSTLISGYSGVWVGSGTATVKNVYAAHANFGSAYFGPVTLTTSASSDATGSPGLQNIPADATTFVSTTPGSEDLHIVEGSGLRDVGTDTSGEPSPLNFTDDIDGDIRVAPWDIGADEYVGAPPAGSSLMRVLISKSISDGQWGSRASRFQCLH